MPNKRVNVAGALVHTQIQHAQILKGFLLPHCGFCDDALLIKTIQALVFKGNLTGTNICEKIYILKLFVGLHF